MESITRMDSPSPITNIRERLAKQISPPESPVLEDSKETGSALDEVSEGNSEDTLEAQQPQSIDEFVSIDPNFILEDETSRNTQYNSMLYDQESDSSLSNLVPDSTREDDFLDKYRLLESSSSLSLEPPLTLPAPLRPTSLSRTSSSGAVQQVSSPIYSRSGTPIRSTLKSPSSTPRPNPAMDVNPNYEKRILFNTLNNSIVNNPQLILKTKHKGYRFTRISRTFLCGYDDHEYSETALQWTVDELLNDGDTIVCLKVLEKDSFNPKYNYLKENGRVLDKIISFNRTEKKISIVLEVCVAEKVSKKILQLIKEYDPSLLVVGTSGVPRKGFRNIITPKSMSKYCLQYSEIPVVVVRPNHKPQVRRKSCFIETKKKKVKSVDDGQSLDALVMKSGSESSDEEETVVEIDEDYYKKMMLSCNEPSLQQQQQQQRLQSPAVEERRTRSQRPRSMMFARLLTPQRSHDSTASGTDELLKPVRSHGFSPVRSLSPFWRKNK